MFLKAGECDVFREGDNFTRVKVFATAIDLPAGQPGLSVRAAPRYAGMRPRAVTFIAVHVSPRDDNRPPSLFDERLLEGTSPLRVQVFPRTHT